MEECVFDDADASLGLPTSALQPLELPRLAPLPQLTGAARTDRIVNSLFSQAARVGVFRAVVRGRPVTFGVDL